MSEGAFLSRRVLVGCVALSALAAGASGTLTSPRSLMELAAEASDIIVAEAQAVTPMPGGGLFVSLEITGVLKGSVLGSTVTATCSSDVSLAPGAAGIWFLAEETGASYSILSTWSGGAARAPVVAAAADDRAGWFSGPASYPYAADDPVLDKLVSELRSVTSGGTDEEAAVAYRSLRGLLRERDAISHYVAATEAHREGCAFSRAAREWEAELLARVEARVALHGGGSIPGELLRVLAGFERPASVPGLARLLASGSLDAWATRAVAEAMASIHSAAAVPQLGALLDNGDTEVQASAIGGLAAFAVNAPPGSGTAEGGYGPLATPAVLSHRPSKARFAADPAYYVNFWRIWAACESCRRDVTPPHVAVLQPTAGAWVRGVVTVQANGSDDAQMQSIRLRVDGIDGESMAAEPETVRWTATWDSRAVPDGAHTITAVARDWAGYESTTAPVTFTVDNTTPPLALGVTPSMISPSQTGQEPGGLVSVIVAVNAGVGIVEPIDVQLESIACNDACDPNVDVAGAVYGTDDRSFSLRDAPAGRVYTIYYSARDRAGNVTAAQTPVTVAP